MKPLKSLVGPVFSFMVTGVFLSGVAPATARCQEMSFDDLTRAEFKDYRDWKRVNRTPLVVPPDSLTLALFN